jgi:hypothetical protein
MAYGAFADTKSRYRDLDELVDYREYEGTWTLGFQAHWLKPGLKALGYTHVRFFGGTTFDCDGSFRERVCELARQGSVKAEFFRVRMRAWSLSRSDVTQQRSEGQSTNQMKENSRCT